jgi:photosystem II stability/assembly factor-like uncharacterized protein
MVRKTMVVLAAVVALFAVGQADWVSVGPAGGPIYCATVAPGSPPTIYAASTNYNAPLLKSSDGGANWTSTTGTLSSYPSILAPHPTDPNTVFGVASSVFYRSTNAGTNWSSYSLGSNTIGNDLAVNPLNPQVIYSAGYKYDGTAWRLSCMKSTNAGQTWSVTQLDTAASTTCYSVAIDPVDTNVVYAGGYVDTTTACYKSLDCGATWTKYAFPANYYYIYSFCISPTDHNTIFAGTLYGICRSTDAGQTWTRQNTCNYNYRIVSAPDDPSKMYSAAYSSVYRSTDAGLTWTSSSSGLQGTTVRTVLTVPGENGAVYCGSTAGMFKSTDYGLTWLPVNNGIAIGKIPVVAVSPDEPGVVFAEFIDNAIFKTTDEGASWLRQPVVLSCGNVCSITFDPHNPQMRWMFEGSG